MYMKKRKGYLDIEVVIILIGIVIAVIVVFVSCARSISVGTGEMEYIEVTVVDKGIKNYKSKGIYLVYGEDDSEVIHVFQITDSLLAGRFNSSDVYGKIRIGEKYRFGVRGERNEVLSWYPNIYEFELIPGAEKEKFVVE